MKKEIQFKYLHDSIGDIVLNIITKNNKAAYETYLKMPDNKSGKLYVINNDTIAYLSNDPNILESRINCTIKKNTIVMHIKKAVMDSAGTAMAIKNDLDFCKYITKISKSITFNPNSDAEKIFNKKLLIPVWYFLHNGRIWYIDTIKSEKEFEYVDNFHM